MTNRKSPDGRTEEDVWGHYKDLLRKGERIVAEAYLKDRSNALKTKIKEESDEIRTARVLLAVEGKRFFTEGELLVALKAAGVEGDLKKEITPSLRRHGYMFGNHNKDGKQFMGWKSPEIPLKPVRRTQSEQEEVAVEILEPFVRAADRILQEDVAKAFADRNEPMDWKGVVEPILVELEYKCTFGAWMPPRNGR